MPTITKEYLQELLEKCIATVLEEARKDASDEIPTQVHLSLEASGYHNKEIMLKEVMALLFRDGTFPKIVDVAMKGIKDGRSVIWIRPSSHPYVSDFSQTWNTPAGMGPFKCIGLILPNTIWKRNRPLSIQDLIQATEMS